LKRRREKIVDDDLLFNCCELDYLFVARWCVLKLVVLHGVSYIMVVIKIIVCLVSFDGVWRWFNSTWEVVCGIYEWEYRTYLTSYISKAKC
jgi:hypothetical protein